MSFISLRKDKYQKMLRLKRNLLDRIEEPEFKSKIESLFKRIDFYKVKFTDDGFVYKNNSEEPYIISIGMSNDKIYFNEQELYDDRTNMGIYKIEPTGKSYIKYVTEDKTIYKNIFEGKVNKDYDSYNITTDTIFQFFDEDQVELWYLEETKQDNYFFNKKTLEKVFPNKLSYFENYVEKNYYFRDKSGYIINRFIRKFHYKNNDIESKDEDFYLISKNYNPNDDKLPRGGYYVGIPKELYSEYKLGKCDFNKVYKSRVKSKINTIYY